MENFSHAIEQLQNGALSHHDFFAALDRILENTQESGVRLLELLSEAQARTPLPAEIYKDIAERIERAVAARQRMGADDTFVQTRPGQITAAPVAAPPTSRGAAPAPDPERMKGLGDTLNGRFVLEECIGFGGMGTVYKALDLRKLEASDRQPYIAIKVLNVQFRGHPKSLIALQREARKAQSLAHPNIVSVYDFDRDGGVVYLTMEYLSGKPLNQLLRAPDFAGLPFAQAMPIVTGMANALAYAHAHGFVHCDFKPGNVFLTDAGVVKVIDFGIARVFQKAEADVDVTVFDPGSLGALTPAYASPEMLEQREPDPRDDIYALACITYELLSGHHPFNRMSALQAKGAGLRPQRPPHMGRRKWRGLRNALAFERTARTPTVARFLEDIGDTQLTRRYAVPAAWSAAAVLATLALLVGPRLWAPHGEPSAPASELMARTDGHAPAASAPSAAPPPTASTRSAAQPPIASAPSAAQLLSSAPAAPAAGPPAPATVAAALARVPCAALMATPQDHALRVTGFLAQEADMARLRETLSAIPGVATVAFDVAPLAADTCPMIAVLAPYWSAQRRAGGSPTIRLAGAAAGAAPILSEGDPLMVDVTTASAESFITLDYYALDGSVVHLLPNPRTRDNRAPPHYTATIGSMGEWGIGKPFGTELLVLVTTPVPLFATPRPVSESRADYLAAVAQQLAQIDARNGNGTIAVDFLQIHTRARKH